MDINQTNQNNQPTVESLLAQADEVLRKAINISLEEIKTGKQTDKQMFELWAKYVKGTSDYFMKEAERTNNEDVAKNVIKYIMFRKF